MAQNVVYFGEMSLLSELRMCILLLSGGKSTNVDQIKLTDGAPLVINIFTDFLSASSINY